MTTPFSPRTHEEQSPNGALSHLPDADSDLLDYRCEGMSKEDLYLPGPDFVERVWEQSDRSSRVLRNLQALFDHGRLGGSGYLSILPVDQGIEHTAGASFAPNPIYFDPKNIVELAIEGGCNAVASTLGVLGSLSRRYAHKIPFVVKINHNELMTYPKKYDQVPFASVHQAWDMGAVAIGATVYFGAENSMRQLQETSEAFSLAHELGMATILWCYVRNEAFTVDGTNYEVAADTTSQALHLGATIEADILKQKMPETNRGFSTVGFGRSHPRMYEMVNDHPIDWVRWQVVNSYMGRIGVINSGGASGDDDFADAVKTAVINKRAGGMGLIMGRKAFQRPMQEGIEILNAVQDVYLDPAVTIA